RSPAGAKSRRMRSMRSVVRGMERASQAPGGQGEPPAPSAVAQPPSSSWMPLEALPLAFPAQRAAWALGAQRALGNRATAAMVQAKLVVGSPRDPLEREADEVADRVMRRADVPAVGAAPPAVQRRCAPCEEERIQRREVTPAQAPGTAPAQ